MLGPADIEYSASDHQPVIPAWWYGPQEGESRLGRSLMNASNLPEWDEENSEMDWDLPSLGKARQKVADMEWWRPHIHQLLLYAGCSRQGQAARARRREKGKSKGAGKATRRPWTWTDRELGSNGP